MEHGSVKNIIVLIVAKRVLKGKKRYYTQIGTEKFTDQVVSHIASVLEIEHVPSYKEVLYTDKPIGF